jgi:hypothetical protein
MGILVKLDKKTAAAAADADAAAAAAVRALPASQSVAKRQTEGARVDTQVM